MNALAVQFTSPSYARQRWLEAGVVSLRALFAEKNFEVPANVRVSIGWPKGSHGKGRAIGQCWYAEGSSDQHNEIFISPELGDGARILDVLAHELAHAVAGHKAGHKAPFKRVAEAVGLTGKMTATVAGEAFAAWAAAHIKTVGAYPGGTLSPVERKKQSTRLIKCECEQCGFTVRTTRKWIAEVGAPHCPNDGEMNVETGEED
jgi:hypothetical protein